MLEELREFFYSPKSVSRSYFGNSLSLLFIMLFCLHFKLNGTSRENSQSAIHDMPETISSSLNRLIQKNGKRKKLDLPDLPYSRVPGAPRSDVRLFLVFTSSVARGGGGGGYSPPPLACRPKCRIRKIPRF